MHVFYGAADTSPANLDTIEAQAALPTFDVPLPPGMTIAQAAAGGLKKTPKALYVAVGALALYLLFSRRYR